MWKSTLFLIIIVITFAGNSYAEPSINPVPGSYQWSHKAEITITGSDFGLKSPAKPLMWDDCEDGSVGSFPISAPNAESQVGYSDYQPQDIREGEDIPDSFEMNYRSFPHTHVTTPVTAPHSHSTKFLGGAHYEDNPTVQVDRASGRDVDLTVATPESHATHWYVNYYYRLNPEWPACGSSPNHKMSCLNSSTTAYYGDDFSYFSFNNGDSPCTGNTNIRYRHHHDIGTCDDLNGELGSAPYNAHNPVLGWVKMEETATDASVNGGRQAWIDGNLVWSCTSGGAWYTARSGGTGIKSFTIGGYYRVGLVGGTGRGYQDSDAFRYFDDIYIDSTLARVVLVNNSNYDNATVIEPQIPSVWSNGSITFTVNLGKFEQGETAYLFVFDADNNHNLTGYPVTIGGSSAPAIEIPGVPPKATVIPQ